MTDSNRLIVSVSELNDAVKSLLESEEAFLSLCVQGEVSNYKVYPSGHHYFTLKDAESSLRCVMFRSSASRLRFRPENGMQILAVGSLRVYTRDGTYQLYCTELIPNGVGDLQLAFEQLKRRLYAEGLFGSETKKPLPEFPERIALVTSSAGAAVHDMIRILGARWPAAKVLLYPVRVQGIEAPGEIAAAIRQLNQWRCADLIITGRGGGSLEDIWAFNEEAVARAIFASEIPVISAVGHEPDVTISDFVADRRASTPSNAAELAVPDRREIAEEIAGLSTRLRRAAERQLTGKRQRLELLRRSRTLSEASFFVDVRRMEIDRLSDRLSAGITAALGEKRTRLTVGEAALRAMSPLKVLNRGYLVAENKEHQLVRSAVQLRKGDSLTLRFADGRADCVVENLEVVDLGGNKTDL